MGESIWEHKVDIPAFPVLDGVRKTDVLIIGGGLAGLLCAYKLAQSNADVLLIEKNKICRGITGHTTAKITSQHGLIYSQLLQKFGWKTARHYWEAHEAAIREYAQISSKIACDFERKTNYIYSVDKPARLQAEWDALRSLQIPSQYTRELEIPISVSGAIGFRDQAQFDPLKFAAGIARGLPIYEHTKALSFCGNTVRTNYGEIHAKQIIIATHFPMLNKHGCYFLKMYQNRSYVLALENAKKLDAMYLDESADGVSLRSCGNTLLIGGGGHRTGKKSSGWEPLEGFAQKHYPQAKEAFRWAAQDCMTLDGMPYIGQYSPRTPGLYVATGFNKWGMTGSMLSAMILSNQVLGKKPIYTELFSPSRSIWHPQLLMNAAESVWNYVTPTAPRCPHLGCALKWNPQEHSWDCPCHGSRFAEDGKLCNGPATGDLNI